MFTKLLGVSAGLILSVAGVAPGADNMPTKFTVRIENIYQARRLYGHHWREVVAWFFARRSGGTRRQRVQSSLLGRRDRGQGLEAQSEDGDPGMLAKALQGGKEIKSVAVFNTPSAPAPLARSPRRSL